MNWLVMSRSIKLEMENKKALQIKIKILDNSHTNVFIFDGHYSINETFNIDVRDYARPPFYD